MVILGINGVDEIFHDASASLVVDGKIVASVEEERFNRKKHSNGIPFQAIEFCLKKGGIEFAEIDQIGYYLDPEVLRTTLFTDVVKRFGCDPSRIAYIARAADNIAAIESQLRARFRFGPNVRIRYLNHHLAHAASVYYASGFDHAAILTVDGAGDRESSVLFQGIGDRLEKVHDYLVYPESLGFIYSAFAAHLGLSWISGPGKLMGLAGYGCPDVAAFSDIVRLVNNPLKPVEIDLSFFDYYTGGPGLSSKGLDRFGRPVCSPSALNPQHWNLAASVQRTLENAVVHIVQQIPHILPGEANLCFSGGVALNVKTNRILKELHSVRHFFVNPPAYDGGTSLGCALLLDAKASGRHYYAFNPYQGPDIERDYDIEAALRSFHNFIEWRKLPEFELIEAAADALVEGRFIGWVQGRMECGPRALGNRSILANPTFPDTKDRLNAGIKKRENFRPYAPSVLQQHCADWFDVEDSPYMLLEANVHSDKRDRIPAVVHVDGSSRPQTVTEEMNPKYHRLIRRFHERTGIPLILNTSFNQHGEPVVNRPEEAITVLLTTRLDDLFIGCYHVRRNPAVNRALEWVSIDGRGFWRGAEIPDALERKPVVHSGSILQAGGSYRISTAPAQWSYAAAFRWNGKVVAQIGGSPILVRTVIHVEEGRIGLLFVRDDLQTVLGTPVECSASEAPATLDILLPHGPFSGWLVLRNNRGGNEGSSGVVESVRAYVADSFLPA